jgi:hypothetical protein
VCECIDEDEDGICVDFDNDDKPDIPDIETLPPNVDRYHTNLIVTIITYIKYEQCIMNIS